MGLGKLLGYFIDNNCKMSTPLTWCLFNSLNAFQCIDLTSNDYKCGSVRQKSRSRELVRRYNEDTWVFCCTFQLHEMSTTGHSSVHTIKRNVRRVESGRPRLRPYLTTSVPEGQTFIQFHSPSYDRTKTYHFRPYRVFVFDP